MNTVFRLTLLSAALVAALPMQATDRYRTNNTDNLELNSSWTNGTPGSTDVAVWDSTVATIGNCTNGLGASKTWGGIRILNPAAGVKVTTSASATLSLGSAGIDLSQPGASQDLWLALPVTTTQPQTWSIKPGRTLTVGETNSSVNISANTALNGRVRFPNNFNLIDGGTLSIADGATLEPTLSFAGEIVQVGNNAAGGTVNQAGGSVKLNRTDGTSGSPKASLTLASSSGATALYNIGGGSLIDTTPGNITRVDLGGGSSSTATLNLSGTALVQVASLRLANANGATATVNLSNNCLLTVTGGNLDIGRTTTATYNQATLNVYGGTLVSLGGMNVPHGNGPGAANLYGGTVLLGGNLAVAQAGGTGNGTVNINGGSLTITNGTVSLPDGGSGTGNVNLNGGVLTVAQFTRGAGATSPGALLLNGGTLAAAGNSSSFIAAAVTVNVGTNGARLDTGPFNLTIPAALLHGPGAGPDGGLVKLGVGTLAFTGSNTFNGPMVVSNGTLLVNSFLAGDAVVCTNASLSGTGAISGVLTVNPGGVLAPGVPTGLLILSNPPNLNGTVVMEISKAGLIAGANKLSVASGALNYHGALSVTGTGDPLIAGDTFALFDAPAFSGAFTSLSLPVLTPPLTWDTSQLGVDGTLRVAGGVVPVIHPAFDLPVRQNGTNLWLSGSGGYSNLTYYVLSSTNAGWPLTNWTLIDTGRFGANGSFIFSASLNPKLGAQYFALALTLPTLPQAQFEILSMLANIRGFGFDGDPQINSGLGGLWVNWRYGTSPLLVNWNGSGQPDGSAVNPPRHDDLTDLRYLHNLLSYKSRYPLDPQFDADIGRYTAIVKYEFNNSQNERGWIYDEELLPMWWLSGDPFFLQQALNQANYFANNLFKPNLNAYYKTSSTHTNGYFRVDWEIEIGCALVQAGTVFSNASWVTKGQQMVQFAYDHAYITNSHVFLQQMDNVLLPNGTANPNPTIYQDGSTDGGNVRFGAIGQEILSLFHTYQVTSNPYYLARATEMLDGFTADANPLGMWDTTYGGYYGGLEFPGADFLHAGQPGLIADTKECGRQMAMLEAFHVANAQTANRYAATEAALLTVALKKAYYAAGHGVLYESLNDWTPVTYSGTLGDWVTTEAMGIVLEALFSLDDPRPW